MCNINFELLALANEVSNKLLSKLGNFFMVFFDAKQKGSLRGASKRRIPPTVQVIDKKHFCS